MSNDPKKPLDPTPAETPDILQRDLQLDRRSRHVPSFEELKTNAAPPRRPDVAMTQPGIPGPFQRPPQAPPPRASTPPTAPGTIAPGNPQREPTHFELAMTAATPRHVDAQPRPVVTAQPAPPPPMHQVTRAPIAQVPPGMQPRAHAAPTQPHPIAAPPRQQAPTNAPPPAQRQAAAPPPAPQRQAPPPAAPPQRQAPPAAPPVKLAGPTVPLHANPRMTPEVPTAPARQATPAPAPRPPPDTTRPGIAPRQAPPSPVDWASRAAPAPQPADAPTMPVPALGPKLTAAKPMEGATLPSGANQRASYAPAHVPVAPSPQPAADEFPTAPNRPIVARPQAPAPSFRELPQAMPSHLVVTQPGIPGPYAQKRDTPMATTKGEAAPPPPAGPTRVLESHPPTATPIETPTGGPDFGEVPAFEPVLEPVESVEEAAAGDVVAAPASLWRRVLAWVFDLTLIAVVVGGFFGAALAVIGKPSPSLLVTVAGPAAGVVGFVAFVYTTLFAFLWHGRTPGRRLLGIHLVDASGQAPGAGRALVRAALSLASFGLFLSGFWLALFDRRGQTLHDKLTSTFVVRLKPAL